MWAVADQAEQAARLLLADVIGLRLEHNVLTIKAERRFDGQQGDEVIAAERPHGAFTRQLFLSDTLDAERLVAG